MNVTMELITVVKRTQICIVQNGPVNREDEPVALFTNLNIKRVVGCQVFLATEVMVLCLVCFENQGQPWLR